MKILLSLLIFGFPLSASAAFDGPYFDLFAVFFLLVGGVVIFLWFNFWLYLLGFIVLLPCNLISYLDKELDEGLVRFAVFGFLYTFMIPVLIIGRDMGGLNWYKTLFTLVGWLFIWYCLAKFLQFKSK
jgi:hypothetical protein